MKKLNPIVVFCLLLTTIILLPRQSNAQYFAPVGAKWTYDYAPGAISPPPYTVEPLTIEIIKDTIINGLACREAEIAISGVVQAKKYIRSINDSILVYSSVNNQFNLLYDFTANVGDTLKIYSSEHFSDNSFDSSYVKVDSVGFIIIKGISYRAYYQSCLWSIGNCLEGGSGWVIDSLGVLSFRINYLFLNTNMAGPTLSISLRCYSDSNTYYNYDGSNCDTTYVVTNIEEVLHHNFNIYPTILSEDNRKIIIKNINQTSVIKKIQLFSLTGIAVPLVKQIQEGKTELIINQNIPSGIYFLRFALDKEVFTHKIVVL